MHHCLVLSYQKLISTRGIPIKVKVHSDDVTTLLPPPSEFTSGSPIWMIISVHQKLISTRGIPIKVKVHSDDVTTLLPPPSEFTSGSPIWMIISVHQKLISTRGIPIKVHCDDVTTDPTTIHIPSISTSTQWLLDDSWSTVHGQVAMVALPI